MRFQARNVRRAELFAIADGRRCSPPTDDGDAPKFDLDRSELTSTDRAVLQQIAACLTSGPSRAVRFA